MAIEFADHKIHEARQRLTALDRELAESTRKARRAGSDHSPKEVRGRLLQERLKAFLKLLELLELAEMPPDEMGSA